MVRHASALHATKIDFGKLNSSKTMKKQPFHTHPPESFLLLLGLLLRLPFSVRSKLQVFCTSLQFVFGVFIGSEQGKEYVSDLLPSFLISVELILGRGFS
jgi:hypothetical protein